MTGLDSNNEMVDLLVNTTDPYDGNRVMDRNGETHTVRFEVKAEGDWSITVSHPSTARRLEAPGQVTGVNDDVVVITSERAMDTASIRGNSDSHYFGVISLSGTGNDLLVNTTDLYEGTVIMPNTTFAILEITATGDWEITVNTR